MDNNFSSEPRGSTPNPFRFLRTGARELDQLLCFSSVPRGGAINLDFEPGVGPATLLLGMCKTALSRNERLAFIYAPTFAHMTEGDVEGTAALRSGCGLAFEFDMGLDVFSLAPDFNRAHPADPASPLRYFVANTFEEFEDTLRHLLADPLGALDQVFVYGFEQLFQNIPLFRWMEEEVLNDSALVLRELARLRHFLDEVAPRLEAAGTALWLARSADSYSVDAGTLFLRGLRPLLQGHCATTLLVEKTRGACDSDEGTGDIPGVGGIPITLYGRDELLGEAFIPVLVDADGWDGPFLDGEPDVGRFLQALL